jgi:N-acetylglucosaminyldiphosphoundecaprenol N-acetyl-beta-D-mannosaminyltransferase
VNKTKIDENSWQIWGIPLYSRGYKEVLKIISDWLASKDKKKWVATVNPEFVMQTTKDKNFLGILKKTDLNVVDGIGLVWAKRIIKEKGIAKKISAGLKIGVKILRGEYRQDVASGSDLMDGLCEMAGKCGYSVYFLGGWKDRAERTAKYFKSKFLMSKEQIQYCSGEPEINNEEVVREINKFKPDILFVAYGMKRQEEWIEKNLNKLKVGVVMGVGRSFDYYSGDLKRAPRSWKKIGLEWLYSLIQEPKRWKRQLNLPKFIFKVLFS